LLAYSHVVEAMVVACWLAARGFRALLACGSTTELA